MAILAYTPFDKIVPNETRVRSGITGTVGTIIGKIEADYATWNEVVIKWDTGNVSCDFHDKLHMVHVI